MIEHMRATGLAPSALLLSAALALGAWSGHTANAQELDFAVQAGGSGEDQGWSVAVDSSGASTVTGRFRGTATFGAGEPNQTTSAGG